MAKRNISKKTKSKELAKKRRTQKGGDLLKPWTWFSKKPVEHVPVPGEAPIVPPVSNAPVAEVKETDLNPPAIVNPVKVGGRRKRHSRNKK